MSSRTAPRAAVKDTPRARATQDPSQNLTGALAVLDLLRRDRLLEAVAIAARELLRTSDLEAALPKVIEQIGQATGVDRVHLFLVDAASADGRILQHHVLERSSDRDAAGIPERQGPDGRGGAEIMDAPAQMRRSDHR